MIRLYVDHDSGARALVAELRRRDIDILTSLEAGLSRAPDTQQLEFAARSERVLYTANARDFVPLHFGWLAAQRGHYGIIVRDYQLMPIGQQVLRLEDISETAGPGDLANQLLHLDEWVLG